jgi:hydrogen peroxide-dependent heme synthase
LAHTRAAEFNARTRYMMFTVFKVTPGALPDARHDVAQSAQEYFDGAARFGVTVRGIYNVAGPYPCCDH